MISGYGAMPVDARHPQRFCRFDRLPPLCRHTAPYGNLYSAQPSYFMLCSYTYGLHMRLVLCTHFPRTLRPGHPALHSNYPYSNAHTWWHADANE